METLEQQVRRRVEGLAPRRAAELLDGPCIVEGQIGARVTLEAPLGGQAVAGYWLRVEVYRDRDVWLFRKRPWRTVVEEGQIGPFELEDGPARASIEVSGPTLFVGGSPARTSSLLPPERVRRLLERTGEPDTEKWLTLESDKHVRWVERTLAPGAPVTVIGQATTRPAPTIDDGSYRDAAAALLTIGPPADGPLIVADRPLEALVKRLRQPGSAVLVSVGSTDSRLVPGNGGC